MKRRETIVLDLQDQQVVLRSGEFRAELDDFNSWTELRMAVGRNATLAIVVDDTATHEIQLPLRPMSRRELKEMLAIASPVLLNNIAWSSPAATLGGDNVTATLVQRDWLDPRIEEIDRQLMPASITVQDKSRRPFAYTSVPERRRRRITFGIVGLASGLIFLAILLAFAPSGRGKSEREIALAGIFARPGVAETVRALSPASSPPLGFKTLAMDRDGQLAITIETDNPAGVRRIVELNLPQAVAPASAEGRGSTTLAFSHPPLRAADAQVSAAPALAAPDRATANRLMLSRIGDKARQSGVTTSMAPMEQTHDRDVAWSLTAIGSSGNVLTFLQNLESSQPAARLESWRLVADSTGMTLTAKLIMPWSKSR